MDRMTFRRRFMTRLFFKCFIYFFKLLKLNSRITGFLLDEALWRWRFIFFRQRLQLLRLVILLFFIHVFFTIIFNGTFFPSRRFIGIGIVGLLFKRKLLPVWLRWICLWHYQHVLVCWCRSGLHDCQSFNFTLHCFKLFYSFINQLHSRRVLLLLVVFILFYLLDSFQMWVCSGFYFLNFRHNFN